MPWRRSLTRAGFAVATGSSKVGRVLGSAPASAAKARRKDPAIEVLDAGRQAALRELLTADPLLRVDRPGSASRMRAAIRRVRAAVAVGAEIASRSPGDPVRAELGWLDDMVAPLDHADTVPARLREAVAREPRDLVLARCCAGSTGSWQRPGRRLSPRCGQRWTRRAT